MLLSTINRLRYVYFSPSLDNFIYKLCYRWTVLLLVAFSFVVTCRLLLGDSFVCLPSDDLPFYYVNLKCYAEVIYTEPLALKDGLFWSRDVSAKHLRRYQSYYSWVNLLFLIHAFNFYFPHLLWKSYESGYLSRLTVGVQTFFDKEEKRGLELCYLAKYVIITQGKHKFYALMYILLESFNCVISLAQTIWLVHFFNVTGVPESFSLEINTWSDFKNFYFPSSGTCEISIIAVNTTYHSVCEMPMNSLHMNMFLFLHAWYIVLTILCGTVVAYRLALLVPRFRVLVIKSCTPFAEKDVLKSLCHRMSYSDWFFMSRLQKTMTDIDFAHMIDKISVLSHGSDEQKDDERRLSFFDDGLYHSSIETSRV